MDKKTILAFILIGLILVFTQTKFYREKILKLPPPSETSVIVPDSSGVKTADSTEAIPKAGSTVTSVDEQIPKKLDSEAKSDKLNHQDPIIAALYSDTSREVGNVSVETELYEAKISPRGAVVVSWRLKNYNYNHTEKVELIQNGGYGNLGIAFIYKGDTLNTYNSIFENNKQNIKLIEGNDSDSLIFFLNLGNNREIIKKYVFYRDKYAIDLSLTFKNLTATFDDGIYYLNWDSGLKYTELDYQGYISKEDVSYSKAYVYQGGEKEELKLPDKPGVRATRSDFSGTVDWTAIRTKYFAMIILPLTDKEIEPTLIGETEKIYDEKNLSNRVLKKYSVHLKNHLPLSGNSDLVTHSYRVYIGPMDYYRLKNYHPTLAKLMDFGMAIIRPFAKLVLRVFIFMHKFIPNYGLVLILFAIMVKILVWPLTRKSYESMHRMQELQPKLNELKEKYGKDPQRLNRETMKLYKEEGVNPASGCLPQLLQMPLLFAIFIIFRNTIELRDASFIWWIKDLSAPDTVAVLPFHIPFYGNLVNVLPLIMGLTMFLQQKMTVKDPKQKAMVYFMPAFFMLLFNSFPSGLNLYYTLFNVFSMIQQKFIPVNPATPEKNKRLEPVTVTPPNNRKRNKRKK